MKNLLFAFALLMSFQAFAQDNDNSFNPYFQFEVGKTYYLLGDNVNLRAKADIKGEVVAKLPIGTAVKIEVVEETKDMVLNGLNAPWCKVSFSDKGANKTAYLWAGFLSLNALESESDKNVKFLFGIAKITQKKEKDYSYDEVTMQIRVCNSNKEIQKIEFDGRGSITTARSGEIYHKKGVASVESIINIEYSDNYCGGSFGNHIFFWDAKKLYFVKNLQSGADAPCFSSEDFIYPNDEGGKAGHILMKAEGGCTGEESDEIEYSERSMTEYVWKNNKLEEVKKYDIK